MHEPRDPVARARPRRVLILGAAPSQILDIAGPAEVLAQAGHLRGHGEAVQAADVGQSLYRISCLIISEPGASTTSAGLALQSTVTAAEASAWTDLDTLIVVGGEGARRRCVEPAIQTLTRRLTDQTETRARPMVPALPSEGATALGWWLSGIVACAYFAFLIAGALARPALGSVPWSFLLSAGQLVGVVTVMGLYVLIANARGEQ